MIEIRVLAALAAEAAGPAVDLGRPRQRAVPAVLLAAGAA